MLGWWSLAVGRLEVTDDLCFFIRVIQKMSRKLQADQTVSSESRSWFLSRPHGSLNPHYLFTARNGR